MAETTDPGDDHLREEDGDSLKFEPGKLRPCVAVVLKAIAEHRGEATITIAMADARQITCAAAMFLMHIVERGDHMILNLPEPPKPKH